MIYLYYLLQSTIFFRQCMTVLHWVFRTAETLSLMQKLGLSKFVLFTIFTQLNWLLYFILVFRRVPKIATATVNFVLAVSASICLYVCVCVYVSIRTEQISSHWWDFYEVWYLSIFLKTIEKIRPPLKSEKNDGYFTFIPMYTYDNISLSSS